MKIQNLILALAFIMGCSLNGQAQSTPKLTKTQIKQQKRIKKGVQNKALTRKEVKQLAKQQRKIQRTKKIA